MASNPDRPLWLPAAMLAAFVSGGGLAALALPPDVEAAIGGPVGPEGQIQKIVDGDTFEFKTFDGQRLTIRLAQIDAPEMNQPWGTEAKSALTHLTSSGDVKLQTGGLDKSGRTMATVHAGEVNVNFEMVRQGLAWSWPRYVVDPRLFVLEQAARNGKAGLWSDPPSRIVQPETWKVLHPVPKAKDGAKPGKVIRVKAAPVRRAPVSAEVEAETPAATAAEIPAAENP